MKIIKILIDPYTVIISFFMILIKGEGWGGFFLMYLLFGLPHGVIHSLVGFLGVILILVNYKIYRSKNDSILPPFIEIIGIILLILSIFIFFHNDEQHYNYATFYELVPVLMLTFFGIISFAAISKNIISIYRILMRKRIGKMNL